MLVGTGAGDVPGLCRNPTESNIVPTSADLSWLRPLAAFPRLAALRFIVQWRARSDADWETSGELTDPEYHLPDLSGNTEYEWIVQAIGIGGKGRFTRPRRFITRVPLLPTAPTNLVTSGIAQSTGLATSEWLATCTPPVAVSGESDLATTFDFDWRLGDDGDDGVWTAGARGLDDPTFKFTGREPNKRHTWRSRGVNASGPGPWAVSDPLMTPVRTLFVPSVPTSLMSTLITDIKFVPQWAPGPVDATHSAADGFEIELVSSINQAVVLYLARGTDTSIVIDGLDPATPYQWRMRPKNGAGVGEYTEYQAFVTESRIYPPGPLRMMTTTHILALTAQANWLASLSVADHGPFPSPWPLSMAESLTPLPCHT